MDVGDATGLDTIDAPASEPAQSPNTDDAPVADPLTPPPPLGPMLLPNVELDCTGTEPDLSISRDLSVITPPPAPPAGPDPEPLRDRCIALAGSRKRPEGDMAKPAPAVKGEGAEPSDDGKGKEVMGIARAGEKLCEAEGVDGEGMCRCEDICEREGIRDIRGLQR